MANCRRWQHWEAMRFSVWLRGVPCSRSTGQPVQRSVWMSLTIRGCRSSWPARQFKSMSLLWNSASDGIKADYSLSDQSIYWFPFSPARLPQTPTWIAWKALHRWQIKVEVFAVQMQENGVPSRQQWRHLLASADQLYPHHRHRHLRLLARYPRMQRRHQFLLQMLV